MRLFSYGDTDVSEEGIVSMLERTGGSQCTDIRMRNNRSGAIIELILMKMEIASRSETSISIYQTRRRDVGWDITTVGFQVT